ncbi:hypothetical protein NDU88_006493 [Pleurodeles waltl]|uniref:Uncharacterized protein n=1 Tax=Pleurodeles waltl TaxID=8319 RepID=A0AAV7TE37_PLEWA|nr:hypothetical protein NDU88_006493 [Pleurodeles waltl]
MTTFSRIYQWRYKASKILHWLCTPKRGRAPDAYLVAEDSTKLAGTAPIAHAFADYYKELYMVDPVNPQEDLQAFLHDLPVARLSPEDHDSLEAEVTCEELQAALALLQPGKALGPSSFLAEFWRVVWLQEGALIRDLYGGAGERRAANSPPGR